MSLLLVATPSAPSFVDEDGWRPAIAIAAALAFAPVYATDERAPTSLAEESGSAAPTIAPAVVQLSAFADEPAPTRIVDDGGDWRPAFVALPSVAARIEADEQAAPPLASVVDEDTRAPRLTVDPAIVCWQYQGDEVVASATACLVDDSWSTPVARAAIAVQGQVLASEGIPAQPSAIFGSIIFSPASSADVATDGSSIATLAVGSDATVTTNGSDVAVIADSSDVEVAAGGSAVDVITDGSDVEVLDP